MREAGGTIASMIFRVIYPDRFERSRSSFMICPNYLLRAPLLPKSNMWVFMINVYFELILKMNFHFLDSKWQIKVHRAPNGDLWKRL